MDGGFKIIDRGEKPQAPAQVAAAPASAAERPKSAYPSPAERPTQRGPHGIQFDFNQGARVILPNRVANGAANGAEGGSGCATSTPATSCSKARTRAPSSPPPNELLRPLRHRDLGCERRRGEARDALNHRHDLLGGDHPGETLSFAPAAGGTSGTLTVTDGASQAHLTLLGTYTTSVFGLTNDGAGGTFITHS